jgi:hypothetical protein
MKVEWSYNHAGYPTNKKTIEDVNEIPWMSSAQVKPQSFRLSVPTLAHLLE